MQAGNIGGYMIHFFLRWIRFTASTAFLTYCFMAAPVLADAERGTKEEAQALVARALEELQKVGPEAAYKEFSDTKGAFVDRDLYLIVFDRKGTILAHGANNALINKNLWDVADPDGVYFVREFWKKIEASPEGGWVNFKFTNPVTKKIAKKEMWVRRGNDNIIVIAGIYPVN